MLKEQTLFGERDLVNMAIERLKFAYSISQSRGLGALYIAFSGGKDSIVIAHLAKLSGIPHELHYNVVGIDPPEVVYFMREHYPQLHWDMYKKSMWQLIIEHKMPPTQIVRYCCSELKERGGNGKVIVTGVRWAESIRRKTTRRHFEVKTSKAKDKLMFYDNYEGREQFKVCQIKKGFIINPIVDWTDEEVWEFIKFYKLPYCCLYDQGKKSIGCIGCPMQGAKGMEADFKKYPKFKAAYIHAFEKMIEAMPIKPQWKNGEEVFNWWLYGNHKTIKNQSQIEFGMEE
jgi:phosphoadenosine phosphosulfate reductase